MSNIQATSSMGPRGYEVINLSASVSFSRPIATSVHGARYASVAYQVPINEVCNIINQIEEAVEKYQGYNSFPSVNTDASPHDRITQLKWRQSGNAYKAAALAYEAKVESLRCEQMQRLMHKFDDVLDVWLETEAGKNFTKLNKATAHWLNINSIKPIAIARRNRKRKRKRTVSAGQHHCS